MHEASLMQNLMRQIETIAAEEKATKVTAVKVWCGAFSHMTAAHFGEHFNHAATGSIAEGATLDITISDDIADDRAQDILLESIDVAT
ncbi:MAG: hydrogenase/urease maturation nickel metallochaperone HypA [Geminicoccaceae bacterium]